MMNRYGQECEKGFVPENDRVLVHDSLEYIEKLGGAPPLTLEVAGPRSQIYFDPSKVHCAIVTCGGLCPGTNDVIRAIVLELYHLYRVRHIYGVRYGFQGFIPKYGHDLVDLTPDTVANIHIFGGTILSTSRGPQNTAEIVDALDRLNIRLLFLIGGDGTLRAALEICQEIARRELRISVIVIPKTIETHSLVSRSFGFDTAVGGYRRHPCGSPEAMVPQRHRPVKPGPFSVSLPPPLALRGQLCPDPEADLIWRQLGVDG
jgi:6-phosphofructokinase 1